MQEYKRLKPFEKGLFTGLIRKEKAENIQNSEQKLEQFYCEDSSKEGKKEVHFGKTYTWKKAECGLHMKLGRTDSLQCRVCIHQSHLNGFANIGVQVLSKLTHNRYWVKLGCNHKKESAPVGAAYNEYCFECKKESILKRFPEESVILWFENNGADVKVFLPCGHVVLRKTGDKSKVFCVECSSNVKKELLKSVGAVPKGNNRYALSCGHSTGIVDWQRLSNYSCTACLKTKVADRGRQYGLAPTYEYDSTSKRHEFTLPCGHNQYIRTNSISSVPECKVCGKGHYHKASDMYLVMCFSSDGAILKVGVANDTFARIKEFTAGKETNTLVVASVGFKSKFDAIKAEKQLHKKYKNKALKSSIAKKHVVCGFTECYPTSLLSQLGKEFSLLQNIYAHSNRYEIVSEYKNKNGK